MQFNKSRSCATRCSSNHVTAWLHERQNGQERESSEVTDPDLLSMYEQDYNIFCFWSKVQNIGDVLFSIKMEWGLREKIWKYNIKEMKI